MDLSNRLKTIIKYVPETSRVVDVGTDHGYIPIYLTKNNLASFCIACDINKNPLLQATTQIKKYNATNIELRLSDGLRKIDLEDNIDTIIIAGMGGHLIRKILNQDLEIVKSATRLVLQPQNGYSELRKFLHEIEFKIIEEDFLEEDGKFYTIIVAEKGKEYFESEAEYLFGKIMLKNPNETFLNWLHYKKDSFHKLFTQLQGVEPTDRTILRKQQLEEEYSIYKEAFQCIQ